MTVHAKQPHEWVQGAYRFYGAFGSKWFKLCAHCRIEIAVTYDEWRALPLERIVAERVERD